VVLDGLLSNGQAPPARDEEAQGAEISIDRLLTMAEDAPVVRAVNQILAQAVLAEASDVHIEPHRRDLRVLFRIDGVLHDALTLPRAAHPALVSRVKVMASMDIAERRLPQDGHVHASVEGRELDLRISTLPTVLGEKVVIRILDHGRTRLTLPQLEFAGDLLAAWERLITSPYGLILVTGPTGSGKTTTLYTSLARINTPERNIVSIEDPVENQIPRVSQVQVNPKIGSRSPAGCGPFSGRIPTSSSSARSRTGRPPRSPSRRP
jgi:general secretion pathway protein E